MIFNIVWMLQCILSFNTMDILPWWPPLHAIDLISEVNFNQANELVSSALFTGRGSKEVYWGPASLECPIRSANWPQLCKLASALELGPSSEISYHSLQALCSFLLSLSQMCLRKYMVTHARLLITLLTPTECLFLQQDTVVFLCSWSKEFLK